MLDVCEECPLRLYNTKCHNLHGIGNPIYGKCIIIPNVDYKAYKGKDLSFSSQVEIIKDVLTSFTGEVMSNIYVVPLIRCNENIGCHINNDIIMRCFTWLRADILEYKLANFLICGTAIRRLYSLSQPISQLLDKPLFDKSINATIHFNYSPLVKYLDDTLFSAFSNQLIKWYYDN